MSEPKAVDTGQTTKRRGRPPGTSKSATVKLHREIIACTKKGTSMSNREIAGELGCDKRTVAAVLSKYGIKQDELEEYRDNQADILLGLQHRISKSIDDECIQKAPLQSRTLALGILYDKYRLQTNQSTQNVASLHSIADRAIKAVSAANPSVKDNAGIDTVQSSNE